MSSGSSTGGIPGSGARGAASTTKDEVRKAWATGSVRVLEQPPAAIATVSAMSAIEKFVVSFIRFGGPRSTELGRSPRIITCRGFRYSIRMRRCFFILLGLLVRLQAGQ